MHNLRKNQPSLKEPLKYIAKKFAKSFSLLCFDEFHVTDVADAMILENLFDIYLNIKLLLLLPLIAILKNFMKEGFKRKISRIC